MSAPSRQLSGPRRPIYNWGKARERESISPRALALAAPYGAIEASARGRRPCLGLLDRTRLRPLSRARLAPEVRDDFFGEQPHAGAHLLWIDPRERHPERQMRVIGIALEQLDYVVGRADDERLTEEAR